MRDRRKRREGSRDGKQEKEMERRKGDVRKGSRRRGLHEKALRGPEHVGAHSPADHLMDQTAKARPKPTRG